jgi:hypothetical protein
MTPVPGVRIYAARRECRPPYYLHRAEMNELVYEYDNIAVEYNCSALPHVVERNV